MDSPQTRIWGPALWRLLHSLAEMSEMYNTKIQQADELRLWFNLLTSLKFFLPCPVCKKHYNEYLQMSPIEILLTSHVGLKSRLREWLYNLHSRVNAQNSKYVTIAIEDLPALYGNYTNYNEDLRIVNEQVRKGMLLHWVIRDDIHRTFKLIQELRALYGLR
jgi:hypothetical protein